MNHYIIPPRFFRPLEKRDLAEQGWYYSSLASEYFLEGSLTAKEQSGVWIRQWGDQWIVTDCNHTEHQVLHEGTLNLMELINLTRKLWKL